MQEEFPKRLQDFIKGNPEIGDLLKIGSTDKNKLKPDNKTTYDNLKQYAEMLGVGDEFERIARGEYVTKKSRGKDRRNAGEAEDDESTSDTDTDTRGDSETGGSKESKKNRFACKSSSI
jgi:hypothetical protein